ncbi:hypothetical protein FS749_014192 [Ceratobasidium sp. UAMH 11750]|nr:hypothetical protein FS749_014192 [Ceratobasidium sp. UAMH 11750]
MATQIVSQYAYNRPKGMHWSPKPLVLAKRHPLRPIAERTSVAKRSTAPHVVQPVVKVQDEYHEEGALIESEAEGTLEGQGQAESSSSGDTNSPVVSIRDLPTSHPGVSPEDFLRNALPATHTFVSAPPVDHRLGITSPHRLRPSSSMSNISSGSNKSRPPSVMSTNGQIRRSSSRTSGFSDPPVSTFSLAAASS